MFFEAINFAYSFIFGLKQSWIYRIWTEVIDTISTVSAVDTNLVMEPYASASSFEAV